MQSCNVEYNVRSPRAVTICKERYLKGYFILTQTELSLPLLNNVCCDSVTAHYCLQYEHKFVSKKWAHASTGVAGSHLPKAFMTLWVPFYILHAGKL